jgi:hypothetical protein
MTRLAVLAFTLLAAAGAAQSQVSSRTEVGREQFRDAARTCRYVPAAEQRTCMAFELCKAKRDPSACEQRYFVAMERRDVVNAVCKGKQGTALRNCMRDEYKTMGDEPKLEACSGLLGAELRECVREEYRKLPPPPPPKRG